MNYIVTKRGFRQFSLKDRDQTSNLDDVGSNPATATKDIKKRGKVSINLSGTQKGRGYYVNSIIHIGRWGGGSLRD